MICSILDSLSLEKFVRNLPKNIHLKYCSLNIFFMFVLLTFFALHIFTYSIQKASGIQRKLKIHSIRGREAIKCAVYLIFNCWLICLISAVSVSCAILMRKVCDPLVIMFYANVHSGMSTSFLGNNLIQVKCAGVNKLWLNSEVFFSGEFLMKNKWKFWNLFYFILDKAKKAFVLFTWIHFSTQ